MTIKRLSLRRADLCSVCKTDLAIGSQAWWDGPARTVTCVSCHDAPGRTGAINDSHSTNEEASVSPQHVIDAGTAGESSRERYEWLHARREARIDAKFGRLAGIVKFLSDDPQSIKAWKKGSAGERKLAQSLERTVGDQIVLLNDRRVPTTRGNIDHLAIATSGVWVIDAKNYSGTIQKRDVGGWLKTDIRLYVGGRDRTKVADGLDWQVEAVRNALGQLDVPIMSAVCFTDADWAFFTRPFELRGVFVTGPHTLAKRIAEPGPLRPESIQEVAGLLSVTLPPKG